MKKYYGNDNFNLQNAYHDCKSVFENLTENNFQSADFGLVAYYANEIMYALEKALEQPQGEWKLIERKPFIDIACSNCGKVRFKDYAYNCTIEQTLNHLKTVDKDILPIFCENCGAKMGGKSWMGGEL